jgi:hypothetical protein
MFWYAAMTLVAYMPFLNITQHHMRCGPTKDPTEPFTTPVTKLANSQHQLSQYAAVCLPFSSITSITSFTICSAFDCSSRSYAAQNAS